MTQHTLSEALLQEAVTLAETCMEGHTANYIPELARVDPELTAVAVQQPGGPVQWYSNRNPLEPVTLQSTSKLVPLIGLLECVGPDQLFEWVRVEPSGDDFASITRLEQFGPKPSNPMLNAGAITLCSQIPGQGEAQFAWLEHWIQTLFGARLRINPSVFASEKRTGNRNRSLAWLLESRGRLGTPVLETLDLYFALCSYEATITEALYLPALLANLGRCPQTGEAVLSPETCKITLSIMATCGLYDESGTHMVRTGMPAKSGVSGYTLAVVPGKAGIVVSSPRVNEKGNSIRGEIMLEFLSRRLDWHFAVAP